MKPLSKEAKGRFLIEVSSREVDTNEPRVAKRSEVGQECRPDELCPFPLPLRDGPFDCANLTEKNFEISGQNGTLFLIAHHTALELLP
jgi:hypothetical protein